MSDTEQQLAELIMDVDLPKRLQAELAAKDARIAELEAEIKLHNEAYKAMLARAETAEKRVVELEAAMTEMNRMLVATQDDAEQAEKRVVELEAAMNAGTLSMVNRYIAMETRAEAAEAQLAVWQHVYLHLRTLLGVDRGGMTDAELWQATETALRKQIAQLATAREAIEFELSLKLFDEADPMYERLRDALAQISPAQG